MSARTPDDGLNAGQSAAARHLAGPLVIDAGAGSGKTRTLTQRVVCAVTAGAVPGWEPAGVDEVLAITFTEKAAGEIGERVRRALRRAGRTEEARRLDAAWFSTIHGLCARLLRRHALEAGVDPGFRVIDAVEAHRARERAFAEAAEDALAAEAGEALFGAYGFEQVRDAADALARELRTRGLDAEALRTEPFRDPAELLREATAFMERMRGEWDACPSAAASADAQREACGTTLSSLERIPSGLPPHLIAGQVWAALDAHPKPRALKGAEELVPLMTAERDRLLAGAACAATAPMAEELRSLVRRFAERYAAEKAATGALDFDDLQIEALRLLEREPAVAARYREQFRLVMVDEFQDTDSLQLALVRALCAENLCTVGDERQSIYRFRGADVAVYRDHLKAMGEADARRVPLAENYRSHPDVLAFVNAAFGTGAVFGDGLLRLKPARREPDPPVLPEGEPRVGATLMCRKGTWSTVRQEAEAVAERFATLRDAGVPAGSMAVLLRTYTHAGEFASALRARGLQALVVGGSRFLGLPEVGQLRAMCRVLANARDDEALVTVLASPLVDVSDDALWLLRSDPASGRRRGALIEALAPDETRFGEDDRARFALAVDVLGRARARVGRMPLSEVLLRAVEESSWDLRLLAGGDAGRQAYANVLKFVRLADAYEASGGAGAAGFVEYLDTKEESGEHEAPASLGDDASPSVRIMSIHASKGLEFAAVALPQLGDGPRGSRGVVRWSAGSDSVRMALPLPGDRCASERAKTNATPWGIEFAEQEAEAEDEELKRLFYVACTRAEEKLILLGATNPEGEASRRSPLALLLAAEAERRDRGGALPLEWRRVDLDGAGEPDARPERAEAEEPPAFAPAPPAAAAAAGPQAPDRLSYSDVALYERCGLRFYAQKVLRLPAREANGGEGARSFGSAVHAVLQLAASGIEPAPDRLDALRRSFGVPAERAGALEDAVRAYLSSDVAREAAAYESARPEAPFVIPAGDAFLLRGTIDLYARSGTDALIVDHKTGTSGDAEALRERYALQAACYGLVALRDGCERARVVFVRPEVVEDGSPQRIEFAFAVPDADAIEERLLAVHAGMAAGEYEPRATYDRSVCEGCPAAATLCPRSPRPRQRSQR